MVLLTLFWLLGAASTAAAQNTRVDAPKTRADFEKLVLERAHPDSLATDFAGAFGNIYQYLVPARFLDGRLYEQALQQMAVTDGLGCGPPMAPRARLACMANHAATALTSLTLFSEAILLRTDAVNFAEGMADADPAPLTDSLLALAGDEWTHGSMMKAEAVVRRASALMAGRPDAVTARQRMLLAVLQAQLADARLDDGAAVAALSEAVNAQLAKGTHREPADGYLSDLVMQHLRGRFCPKCGHPVAEPVQRWLTAMLQADLGSDFRAYDEKTPDRMGLLLKMLIAPQGTVPTATLQSYARRYLAAQPPRQVTGIRKFLPPGTGDVATAQMLTLSYFLEGGSPIVTDQPRLRILREAVPRRQAILMKEFLEYVVGDHFSQFGADILVPAALEEASWHYERAGLRNAARLTLEFLMDWQRKRDMSGTGEQTLVKETTIRQARVFVLALARLAALQLAAGDRAAATKSLGDASAIAQAKLRAEWRHGGERTILTMRDLSEALRLIAQTRHELLAPTRFAENPPGADALFRAMQAAITGETGLTLEVARQRRILSTPRLAELRREHLHATAEAARIAEIEQRYEPFNYEGAMTRARREAETRRDELAAELDRLAAPQPAAGDIEPVTLEEAKASLRSGEALVLLRVGSHSLDGFLLDHDGSTSIWRTSIHKDELEALVKSLRAGVDMATSRVPEFKVEEAARLHDVIFGSAKVRLSNYRKLIVLGDGSLQSLPYGILLTRKPAQAPKTADGFRAAALPWLVRTHAIALVPSVRSLVAQRSSAAVSTAPRPFLGVGNPQLASSGAGQRSIDVTSVFGSAGSGLADVGVLRTLASLPETEDELRQIADVLRAGPEDIVVGAKANEAALKAMPLEQYRTIAFATHGALAGELAGTSEPGLVLTPPIQATVEDDGYLSLSEILGLRLDADLVILSACNTGTSDGRPRAESLSGLARGFFNAGARSLLVTHWTIPSESAVKTTTGLVAARGRDQAMDWADALREATLAIIDKEGPAEWAHPTFWGGYVAIGVLPTQ
ncbi:hypothetical protein LMTR13_03230 [Bradyrhizobium icense]|uniref:CHAT domain-containing protein n=1 Tax=Bradyrhizobium icense TaxID=1274631 RepID=A0A1B1U994_9BRAD|nr:hypothetical protein LMTR13_03230 [Bradyrhizobium icense]